MTVEPQFSRLNEIAQSVRMWVVRSLAAAGSGHLGGSLGLADVLTVLYFHAMRHNPKHPDWPGRDRLILSIGHVAPVLYSALAHAGYFSLEELLTLRKLGSRLQGHPGRDHGLPGLELSAGSLGQGLSVAVGMAMILKDQQPDARVFCVMGDGELQEGSVWEAAMAASHYNLSNLIGIVDRNGLQIDGPTEKVMQLEPLHDKWASFGWAVSGCDGHDIPALIQVLNPDRAYASRPHIILAHTKMGKGIPAIENNHLWHGKAPTQQQADEFIKILGRV
jgi:transketolase